MTQETTATTTPDTAEQPAPVKANARPKYAPQRGGGPMGHGPGGGSVEKAVSFGPSMKRLLGHLRPEIAMIVAVVVMTLLATIGNSVGPLILGHATDLIFSAHVLNQTAIDFGAVGQVLLLALVLYVVFFLLSWASGWMINGIVQRSVYRMRAQVSEKLTRLPLRYFDGQPRAFRWTLATGMQDLGSLGGGRSEATAVSADGTVVVGFSFDASGQGRAFRWTSETGIQALEGESPSIATYPYAVTADGSAIVGLGSYSAFRWKRRFRSRR